MRGWLSLVVVIAACGRVGFEASSDGGVIIDSASSRPPARIGYAGPFVARNGDVGDDPAGAAETVELVNDNVGYVLSMVTLKPAG